MISISTIFKIIRNANIIWPIKKIFRKKFEEQYPLINEEEWNKKITVNYLDLDKIMDIYKAVVSPPPNIDNLKYDSLLNEDNKEDIDPHAPKKHCDIRIIRSSKHDGTLSFVYQTIAEAFEPLVNQTVYDKSKIGQTPIGARIGSMRVETTDIKEFDESKGFYYTQKTKVCIPVKFEY